MKVRELASRITPRFASCAVFACLLSGAIAPGAAMTADSSRQLTELSLEELSNLEITSTAKRPQRLRDAASAVYVITGDDIRRAGATSIAEALRLAPNLQLARADASQYAITARGFNGTSSNKLLVMIDGRSVYTPLFSGVFWDVQNTLMENVERIEVISGPGATLWGANAVNGIINVITRSAADTAGAVFTGWLGPEEKGAGANAGAKLSGTVSWRVYGKVSDHDASVGSDGSRLRDAWRLSQGGFRLDKLETGQGALTLQGDIYRGVSEQPIYADRTLDGGNLVGRWSRHLQDGGDLQVQAYYDYTKRIYPGTFGETLGTCDLDVQHGFQLNEQHRILWGGGYRYSDDDVQNTPVLGFLPAHRILRTSNLFVQDQFDLMPDLLTLTLGSKFEHNVYSGFDAAPSARLLWKVTSRHQLWSAVSRAVRTPSRIDTEFFVPSTPPFLIAGGSNFRTEKVTAYELGYRGDLSSKTSLSATVYRNAYKDLRNIEVNSAGSQVLANRMTGNSYGLELWGEYRPIEQWRLQFGYTYLHENLRLPADTADPYGIAAAGNDPAHQASLRSSIALPHDLEWDMMLRHVGRLPYPPSQPLPQNLRVPAYTDLNMRLAWKPTRQFELALLGQNLLHASHLEFFTAPVPSEIERSIFVKGTWIFQ